MEERTCFNCKHSDLCYIRKGIHDLTLGSRIINLDGDELSAKWPELLNLLAKMCFKYEHY